MAQQLSLIVLHRDGGDYMNKHDFLIAFYDDQQAEMRWRKETEYRILRFYMLFAALITTAIGTVYEGIKSPGDFLLLICGTAVFIIVLAIIMSLRIRYDHEAHAEIGRTINRLWHYYEVAEILPARATGEEGSYGSGPGYLISIIIIWVVSVGIIGLFVLLGVAKGSF